MIEEPQQFISSGRAGKSAGNTIARVLTGAWRVAPEAQDLSEGDLSLVAPFVYESGDAALAWWRIHRSPLATSTTGELLHDAYRHLRLAERAHEREIKHVVSLFRAAGIEPVLVKGWAVARLYPDSSLRPYGDIDLCVAPAQFSKAQGILERLAKVDGHFIDLHDGFTKLTGPQTWHGRPAREGGKDSHATRNGYATSKHGQDAHATWDELFERSQLVDLGEEKIRVLSDEDHLRVLCLHLLRSGAWRPLWLCDVALAMELRAPEFDWNICLGQDRRQADWIACTIGLAHHLLGVDIEDTPVAARAKRLPRWLAPAVLRQWDRCRNPHAAGLALPTLLASITDPKKIFSELYARWDNPVRATVALRGRFNDWLRLPYQLTELITNGLEVPRQLSIIIRERWQRSMPGAEVTGVEQFG